MHFIYLTVNRNFTDLAIKRQNIQRKLVIGKPHTILRSFSGNIVALSLNFKYDVLSFDKNILI